MSSMSYLYRYWYDIRTWFPVILSLIIYHSDLMTPEGSGYLQQKFSTFCPKGCGIKEITKETLGLRKLAIDLASGPDSFLAWVALQNSPCVPSHFWSRGTLFNPSSPSAALIYPSPPSAALFNPSSPSAAFICSDIKSKICKRAKVSTPSQSGLINENAVVDIMKYVEYSLSTLKGKILTSQVGPSRRLCVWKFHYLLRFMCLSLFKELQEYWVPTLMTKPIQWS